MTPYYDRDGITIYHARCEDVLPSIDPADAAPTGWWWADIDRTTRP